MKQWKYPEDSLEREGRMNMNISEQIRVNRKKVSASQEDLAERVYVSRQTISSWENGKSYPDLQSLLLLSEIFSISLDELIKGDVEEMKEKISSEKMKWGSYAMVLFFVLMVSMLPFVKRVSSYFMVPMVIFALLMIGASILVEKEKKLYQVETYGEILEFMEGRKTEPMDPYERKKKLRTGIVYKILGGFLVGGGAAALLLWIF
ncbi:helix-turn-helix transcriptional regulator [Proteiniclasticum ruminis]|nr:helix-turn-helix transcriptional regulator [Proteiniclasticum ruminis]